MKSTRTGASGALSESVGPGNDVFLGAEKASVAR
jgi:hypothetical protein